MSAATEALNLRDYSWKDEYRTSSLRKDGTPVDILRDFYIPALERSVSYSRVAGYFTSSSLAAASQGFSAFSASGGKMRLIAGADLAPEDVAAILQGEEARLEASLARELEVGPLPADVRRGVELLCWMVAREVLEVRVAFRVHGGVGTPLPFNSVKDGYVHEKWALFEDALGNTIRISGSLNESKTALVKNAENISLDLSWLNYPAPERIERGKKDFEALWRDDHPYFRVLSLPEAVRQRLIQIGEKVFRPHEADDCGGSPKPSLSEWLAFKAMKMAPSMPGGVWTGMETSPVEPWPHQRVVARRLVENWPAAHLLCDEVGLGKTIEAGLAFRSLLLSGMASRILIAAPASLTRQWQREMAEKFFMPFTLCVSAPAPGHEVIFPDRSFKKGQGLLQPDLVILSTGLIVRPEREKSLRDARDFDIILLDEAHYARRKEPASDDSCRTWPDFGNLYKVTENILKNKTESLWLASATPVQLDWIEAYDLFRLSGRGGAFEASPSMVRFYYDILVNAMGEKKLTKGEWNFLRAALLRLKGEDPFYWEYLEKGMIRSSSKTALKAWMDGVRYPSQSELRYIRRLLFAAAPLSRVMMRHSRKLLSVYREKGELKANLAEREISPLPQLAFSAREKAVYDALEEYCSGLTKQIAASVQEASGRVSLGFYLSFLRQRSSSSFYALLESLKRRKRKVEATLSGMGISAEDTEFDPEERDDEKDPTGEVLHNRTPDDLEWEKGKLQELIECLQSLGETPSKMKELLKTLERRRAAGRIRQTVIFTRYLDTLNDIRNHLLSRDSRMRLGVFSGKYCAFMSGEKNRLESTDREGVKRRFMQGGIDVLLCTDAAAEGLNLQTADILVNYDLPWNPMKVEQRIGRIDRIGQRHDKIYVLNLCVLGSVEEVIYGRLLSRLDQAMAMMGSMPFSLLPLSEDEFNKYAEGELNEDGLYKIALERIERQKHNISGMEMSVSEQYEFYNLLYKDDKRRGSPATLDQIWEILCSGKFLRALGCALISGAEDRILELKGIPGIRDGTCLTADRQLYEGGFPGLKGVLHFATYGGLVFETLVDFVLGSLKAPSGVAEIDCDEKSPHRMIKGLAVKTAEGPRLVTSLAEVAAVKNIQDGGFAPAELLPLISRLQTIAREAEGDLASAVPYGRKMSALANRSAAEAEERAERQLALALLGGLTTTRELEELSFWEMVVKLDERWKDRDSLTIANVHAEPFRELQKREALFWNLTIPQLMAIADISVPAALFKAAVDTACREADGTRRKKSQITVGLIRDRLLRAMR